MAGKTKPVRLWQEITWALVLKVLVLLIIWLVWFSAPEETRLDDQAVASKILSQQPNKDHDHDAVPRTR
jgi:hypothetical protein